MKKIINRLKDLKIKNCDLELSDGELSVYIKDGSVEMFWNMFSNNHLQIKLGATGSVDIGVLDETLINSTHPERCLILSGLDKLSVKVQEKRLKSLERELKISEEIVAKIRKELGYEN